MSAPAATTSAGEVRLALAPAGLRRDLHAIKVIWLREFLLLRRSWIRMVFTFVQPFLFLFVLGTGLGPVVATPAGDIEFKTFIYPGVLVLSALIPSLFSAATIIVDREHGFLREMLVAPVRRGTLVLGQCLAGASLATAQACVLLALAGLVDVPYDLVMFAKLIGFLLVGSFAMVALGVLLATLVVEFASYMAIVQFLVMPMLFLSGAMFPLTNLPGWLEVGTRLDPLSYVVDPMRRILFEHLDVSAVTIEFLNPGITWWGWRVPMGVELAIVASLGLVFLALAIRRFQKME